MSADDKIRKVIAEKLSVDLDEVVDKASFVDDLGADSLDLVELIMSMEEEFDIEIPDEDAEKLVTVKDALDEAPPEIVSDLMENGICLAGGGALLLGLRERLTDELNLRVWVAEDPLTCVARGAGMVLDDLEKYSSLLLDIE